MRFAAMTERLQGLGADKWAVHFQGRAMMEAGRDVIELTIGEPDIPPSDALVEATVAALRAGRTGYGNGQGEPGLRRAIAARHSARAGRAIGPEQVLCLPGTQSALFVAMMALAEAGDEVAIPDPYYATYEGVVRASGATLRPIPTRAEDGFRLTPDAFLAALTPAMRVLLLNNPRNPTGSIMPPEDVAAITRICAERGIWIISDEVYEELVFDPAARFVSPFDLAEGAGLTVVVSSISKSHAAPGFRSGWLVGPAELAARAQPLAEMMLFGNQPFIADATEHALTRPDPSAAIMRAAFARRARASFAALSVPGLMPLMPQAGMFLMLDVAGTGMDGDAFAASLLEAEGVSAMPGSAFGACAPGHLRLSLTVPDDRLAEACQRIARHAAAALARAA